MRLGAMYLILSPPDYRVKRKNFPSKRRKYSRKRSPYKYIYIYIGLNMYKYATCTYLLPFFPQMANLLYSSSLYPPTQVIVKNWGGDGGQ